ncbi:hypothetical protein ACHAXR_001135, partial [Thalassiosira sp. AJA248-18]
MSESSPPTSPGGGINGIPPNNPNNPPPPTTHHQRPTIPPGHASPVRTPHPHDVLSGRGGRINSHPGNVHFRTMVDSYKREYLDPRTKKAEKARIAARIVSNVRNSDPPGRFLKEDAHTGVWIEIGDERAWKKAGQALRESAPEIRAERQAALQMSMMVGVGSVGGGGGSSVGSPIAATSSVGDGRIGGGGSGGGSGIKSGTGRKSRQADPPGPRHRPNPPEREGLATERLSRSSGGGGGGGIIERSSSSSEQQLLQRQGSNNSRQTIQQHQQLQAM